MIERGKSPDSEAARRRHSVATDISTLFVARGSCAPSSSRPTKNLRSTTSRAKAKKVAESIRAVNRLSRRFPLRNVREADPSRRRTTCSSPQDLPHVRSSQVISVTSPGRGGGASPHLGSTNSGRLITQADKAAKAAMEYRARMLLVMSEDRKELRRRLTDRA